MNNSTVVFIKKTNHLYYMLCTWFVILFYNSTFCFLAYDLQFWSRFFRLIRKVFKNIVMCNGSEIWCRSSVSKYGQKLLLFFLWILFLSKDDREIYKRVLEIKFRFRNKAAFCDHFFFFFINRLVSVGRTSSIFFWWYVTSPATLIENTRPDDTEKVYRAFSPAPGESGKNCKK